MKEFDELVAVMAQLRRECPWDREQTILSLRRYLLEEAYECVDAMTNRTDRENHAHHLEELGDVLLQVLFQTEILKEETKQDALREVCLKLKDKLVRRHPHVFGTAEAGDANQVLANWNIIKSQEKGASKSANFFGENLPKALTALQFADKIGRRSNQVKFDWASASDVWKHVLLELEELAGAESLRDEEEELGDLLFVLTQWARHKKIDSEVALAQSNQKFLRRFESMIKLKNGLSETEFKDLSFEEKEDLWKRAKQAEKKSKQA